MCFGVRDAIELALEQSATECNRTLQLMPANAMGHYTLGKVRFLQTNYDAAVSELNAALNYYPIDYLPP